MVKFFWIPNEVWYYVVFPIVLVLFLYFMFTIFYRKKRGSYYYNYVVDYVYSTLGIIFCGLLLCLLLGYSIATFQILITKEVLKDYIFLSIILVILPIIPASFFVYVIIIYLKNLKRKEILDANVNIDDNNIELKSKQESNTFNYDDIKLIKKK